MICEELQNLIGFDVHYMDDQKNIMWIDTPFRFADGDGISFFAEQISNTVRYFDAGETLLHFMGRGLDLNKSRGASFITRIASAHGVNLSSSGDLEILSNSQDHNSAFASYVSALLEIVNWEREQENIDTDMDLLVQEVAMYFRSAYPNELQQPSPDFRGISGHKYQFDFIHGDKAVLAVNIHPNSVSAALKKIIDINQTSELGALKPMIVLDDRKDKQAANNETKVLTVAADVISFTSLAEKAKINTSKAH
jgi:hypothetical protein